MGFFIRTHELESLLYNFLTIRAIQDSLGLQLESLAAESEDEAILSMTFSRKLDGGPPTIGTVSDKTCRSALSSKSRDIVGGTREIHRDLILLERVASQIEIALKILRPRERDVVNLRYFQGLTWQQVADKILFSDGHARRMGNQALSRLTAASKIILDDYVRIKELLLD